MGLTASAGGTTTGQTQVDIVDPAHPIADGLSGTVTVYDSPKKTTFGTPAATATVVADTAGAGTEAVIFTYDRDDTLDSGASAAGRRVGFYFDTNASTVTTDDGWALFDNTVTWTANSPPPITQRSTITLAGQTVATVSEGDVTWLVADNLGSPTVTYRADGSTPASVALYYLYGSPRTAQIDGTGTGFTGQISDLESGTGLAFYNARYYDPALGRFTQPDTIIPNASNGQNFNRYSYVRNNPVNFVDPSGNDECDAGGEACGNVAQPAPARGGGSLVRNASSLVSTEDGDFPRVSGLGVIKLNVFIRQDVVCAFRVCGTGDDRGFDSAAGLADSRATLILDFERGRASGGFNYSCLAGGPCKDAFEGSLVYSEAALSNPGIADLVANTGISGPGKNGFVIFATENGFSIHLEARISVDPWYTLGVGPSINAQIDLVVNDGVLIASHRGDGFPSYEVYQDRGGGGGFERVLQFEQGVLSDLIGGGLGAVSRFFQCAGPC